MEIVRIKIQLFVCLTCCTFIMSCKYLFKDSKGNLPCDFNSKLWALDTCGINGYKKKMGNCLRLNSINKPIFKKERDVVYFLGKPDTILNNVDMSKTYLYVIDGTPSCMLFFPDGVLESVTVYINSDNEVTSISGGIH